ncbi:MAG: (d)CMP kinase [Firmicutes bacterium]|nr:(d)CMP kinase [Bacillota bacterium]
MISLILMGIDETKVLKIAIDGPAASGKGTVAKMLAQRLGIICLDTGALYRGITVHFMNSKVNLGHESEVNSALENLNLRVCHQGGSTLVFLNDKDITEHLHDIEVSATAYKVAVIPAVRKKVRSIQHEIACCQDLVCEGRDITSVVLPDAQFKFYLTASLEERARRRLNQERIQNPGITLEQVKQGIHERDVADMTREISPLVHVSDAVLIDASHISAVEVVQRMLDIINDKLKNL